MYKLLMVGLCAITLAACSSTQVPQPNVATPMKNCTAAKNLVKSNNEKISQAFINRDATAIGSLELQNRDIVDANKQCFPKLQQQIKHWQTMHKNGDM